MVYVAGLYPVLVLIQHAWRYVCLSVVDNAYIYSMYVCMYVYMYIYICVNSACMCVLSLPVCSLCFRPSSCFNQLFPRQYQRDEACGVCYMCCCHCHACCCTLIAPVIVLVCFALIARLLLMCWFVCFNGLPKSNPYISIAILPYIPIHTYIPIYCIIYIYT
jgi:hypothetical protein